MPRYHGEPPGVRVYTVCDESKYLVVKNVPALGCGDELLRLFSTYGQIEECKPMDAEDCEPFTDVYWIKFHQVDNARFAKRKLDEFVFLGNRLQVSYAPHFESLSDTKEKLEGRRNEVLARLKPRSSNASAAYGHGPSARDQSLGLQQREFGDSHYTARSGGSASMTHVSSDKEYFPLESMNQTVRLVREKLNEIQSSTDNSEVQSSKRPRVDNRRRI